MGLLKGSAVPAALAMWDSGTASGRSGRRGTVRRVGRERHTGDACVAPTIGWWDSGDIVVGGWWDSGEAQIGVAHQATVDTGVVGPTLRRGCSLGWGY